MMSLRYRFGFEVWQYLLQPLRVRGILFFSFRKNKQSTKQQLFYFHDNAGRLVLEKARYKNWSQPVKAEDKKQCSGPPPSFKETKFTS